MIILFGDSWARQAYFHSLDPDPNGYQHWHHPQVTVALHENIWLHHFFEQNDSLNQANFGNTTELIIQDLFHFANIGRMSGPVTCVVFQTDPLRIFAPRMDYRDKSVVWPRFCEWAKHNQFDWHEQTLDDLVLQIYQQWYANLQNFEREFTQQGPDRSVCLVGGVSKIHDCVQQTDLRVIVPSISEHFGLPQDLVFENRASLACLLDFWQQHVDSDHVTRLKKQWWHYENLLIAKENFWIQHPQWFAGRHMTAQAMQTVARLIESRMDVGL